MASSQTPFTDLADYNYENSEKGIAENNVVSWTEISNLFETGNVKKLKVAIRVNHWPPSHPIRQQLWPKLCLCKSSTSTSHFDAESLQLKEDAPLPTFVDQSLTDTYYLNKDGCKKLHQLLHLVEKNRPDVCYSPLLHNIMALLLHYMTMEKTLLATEALLATSSGDLPAVHQLKIDSEASVLVLTALLRKHDKKTYDWLKSRCSEKIEMVLGDWQRWIFSYLPFAYQVRIMEWYLNEGIKVLYRAALAILILFHKHHAKSATEFTDIKESIADFCKNKMAAIAIQIFTKTSFGVRGISRKDIARLQRKKTLYIQSMHNSRNLQTPSHCDLVLSSQGQDKVASVTSRHGGMRTHRSHLSRPFSAREINSAILSSEHWDRLWSWLPERITLLVPALLFCTAEHGTSLQTFYQRVQERDNQPAILLIVKTTEGEMFGAYCSEDWDKRLSQDRPLSYFGTGETFVFRLGDSKPEVINGSHLEGSGSEKFAWVGVGERQEPPASASLFMAGDNEQILIGGGGGVAIRLDSDLCNGRTEHTQTFNNPPLASKTDFTVASIEVFGFVQS